MSGLQGLPRRAPSTRRIRRSTCTPTRSCGPAGLATTSTRGTSRPSRARRSAATSTSRGCVDGGMGAQFFGLVSLPMRRKGRAGSRRRSTSRSTRSTRRSRATRRAPPRADRRRHRGGPRAGAIGALLGIEGAHALEGNLDKVDVFARRGVRYLGLLHFSANEAGFPAYGRGAHRTARAHAVGSRRSSSAARRPASSSTSRTSTGAASSTPARSRRGPPS